MAKMRSKTGRTGSGGISLMGGYKGPNPFSYLKYADDGADTEKKKMSWLKDAYVFAKNNEEYLDNPDIQQMLRQKLDKAGFTTIFKPKGEASDITGTMPDGSPYVIGGPGAGSEGQMTEDYIATINAIYQRFMMDYPAQYKPYAVDTMDEGGAEVQRRIDPISGETIDYPAQPRIMTPGSEAVLFKRGAGGITGSKVYDVPTSTSKTGKKPKWKQAWNVNDPSDSTMIDVNETPTPPAPYTFTPPAQTRGERREDLDVLWSVEQQMNDAKIAKPRIKITDEMIDMWNRQLEGAGINKRVKRKTTKRGLFGVDFLYPDKDEVVLEDISTGTTPTESGGTTKRKPLGAHFGRPQT